MTGNLLAKHRRVSQSHDVSQLEGNGDAATKGGALVSSFRDDGE